jgi:arsenite-transporting ATPase
LFETRGAQQGEYVDEVGERFDVPMMLAPLRQDEPVGLDELRAFGEEIPGLDEITEEEEPEVTAS